MVIIRITCIAFNSILKAVLYIIIFIDAKIIYRS